MSAVSLESAISLEDIFEFWTPNEIKSYVAQVGAAYTTLADDIGHNPEVFNEAEIAAWTKNLAAFIEFYKNMGFFSTLSMSAVRTAETFAAQLKFWREKFQQKSGKAPTGAELSIPSQNQDRMLDTVRLISIVAGLGFGAYLLSNIIGAVKTARAL